MWRLFVVPCLMLGAGCGPEKQPEAITRITIDSAPEQGASVMIQGVEQGITPLTIEGLTPGWVDVLLKMDRYKRTADRIEIKPQSTERFVIQMEPLVGYLSLESSPAGADILLDGGAPAAKTPMFRHPLPIGEHTYEIALENYYPIKESLNVEEDFQYEFKHQLKPIEATLNVLSRPTGALIRINNQDQMKRTPSQFKLPPGTYLISVYSKGFVQEEAKVDLTPNQEVTSTLAMKIGEVPPGMVLIPAGEFVWGENGRSPDEGPSRKVFLDAYYIDKNEVTNAEFKKVFPSHAFAKGQEQFPATGVSWSQAVDYAGKVGKRLPSEAEWEKAARGEDSREYPWGAEYSTDLCNTRESKIDGPVRVGSYLGGGSPMGCMDMAGNAYEWVMDWYDRYEGNQVIIKDYGQIYRVLRGGSFATEKFDARCARRHFDRMDATRADYGFRCAKDVAAK